MFDFNELQPDADKAEGVWTRCHLSRRDGTKIDTGVDLLIAYAVDNGPFEHRQAALTAKAQRTAKGRELHQAEFNDLIRRAAVGPVLKGWKGYVLDGQEVPYSTDAAEKAMLRSTQFASFVANFAANLDNFRSDAAAQPADRQEASNLNNDGEEEQDATTEGVLKTDGAVVGSLP